MAREPEVLRGGNVSSVVRVGDTVRRSAGPWSATVQRLLAHVRERGLDWVPGPRGFDENGRDVLTFLPGDVPHDDPDWLWSEQVLLDAARALRRWHDATVDFDAAGATWNFEAPPPHEVVCHNDFAPYDCVFRDGRLVGVIDFDQCAPGSRLWDLAYSAYRFVPLLPGVDRARARARLSTFLDVYGAAGHRLAYDADAVIAVAARRLVALADWTAPHAGRTGVEALQQHAALYSAHARWLAGS